MKLSEEGYKIKGSAVKRLFALPAITHAVLLIVMLCFPNEELTVKESPRTDRVALTKKTCPRKHDPSRASTPKRLASATLSLHILHNAAKRSPERMPACRCAYALVWLACMVYKRIRWAPSVALRLRSPLKYYVDKARVSIECPSSSAHLVPVDYSMVTARVPHLCIEYTSWPRITMQHTHYGITAAIPDQSSGTECTETMAWGGGYSVYSTVGMGTAG